ncbi:MAG: hypothetical protein LBR19_07115 [Bifidobacteriaceae bacterium]|nr:hypothetical protein [Bifidobacteriaceae bacterium]
MHSLTAITKSNDLRGAVPEQWGPAEAVALGVAIAAAFDQAPAILVGHDMRLSGPAMAKALIEGITGAGQDVIDLGQVSTDTIYYASGARGLPGAMLTASHNPAGDNGLKLMRAGAKPMGREAGLGEVVRQAEANPNPTPAAQPGAVTQLDVLPDFARYLRGLVNLATSRPLTVVVDAGNGMGGVVAEAVLGTSAGLPALPVNLIKLYFEPDGTFPNHPANPLDPANLRDLQRAVTEHQADLGLAFDGDADRCFVVDETGRVVNPSVIGIVIALHQIGLEQAAGRQPVIVHNAITSQALPELAQAAGATTLRTPVGHALIKPVMAQHDAVFGAEHSGHYYFRDFFYADTGILSALHVLAALGSSDHTLSALAEVYWPYHASGEINFRVADPAAVVERVRQAYAPDAARGVVSIDTLDGLTIGHWDQAPRWWANVRPSNTEPLLRLNVEAADEDVMVKVRTGLSHLIDSKR